MVELSAELADTLEDTYGRAVVAEYESLFPRDVLNRSHGAYLRLNDRSDAMTPVGIAHTYEAHGLASTLEEIDRLAGAWRQDALAYAVGIAYEDQLCDIPLE